jgi:2-C-methyl-D-erythritol 4-phosphate cytidylyltransferase
MLQTLAGEATVQLRCVRGGARRQDSVAAAIADAPEASWYLVHDGARPLLTAALARATLDAAREHGAAVPGVPVSDTLKRVTTEGRVIETVGRGSARAGLRAVQTPQTFAGALLRRAHASSSEDATDDAALVERLGEPVQLIDGDPVNMKVTTAADLDLVRAMLSATAPPAEPRGSG